jgi:hypothetical protein
MVNRAQKVEKAFPNVESPAQTIRRPKGPTKQSCPTRSPMSQRELVAKEARMRVGPVPERRSRTAFRSIEPLA